ncbi:MAG: hypothetical protein K9J16_15060 [Melioribacteraceae bacterium]|nr:hypothetical protein [Melioribacteraceae bacterium]MCF8355926.1 hypothetical protein [Melioribacteraceae bacterium]MCF8395466.1 hypothetical protein [Melioribacteraceae bacterium]MCF8420780.1 hypothetical protein [Melioribacteraceae bacterium]
MKIESMKILIRNNLSLLRGWIYSIYHQKDKLWAVVWLTGLSILWIWDALFLNTPAFIRLQNAIINTFLISLMVVVFSLIFGWALSISIFFLKERKKHNSHLLLSFFTNLVRSVPQIIGVLIGYILLTVFIQNGIFVSQFGQIIWIAFVISLMVFLEVGDLITERISYFRKSDFFNAMLCCGISESRIINYDILWKNSLSHIIHKLISIFGISIFLLCSVDFIVSVGLSTNVSLTNFPVTLGNLLAKMDSKQDILAIGKSITDPFYSINIFFRHLQGVSTAFIIVFSLICIYKISNGFVDRKNL